MPDTPTSPTDFSLLLQETFPLEGLLYDLLEVSQCGMVLLRPTCDPGTGQVIDFEHVFINPAARRMLSLPALEGTRLGNIFPRDLENEIFGFCRQTLQSGAGCLPLNYQADGLDYSFRVTGRKSGEGLLLSFTNTAGKPHDAVEKALRESQAREQAAQAEVERQRDRMERFLMQIPAGICMFAGEDLIYDFVNPRYQQQLFPGRQLLGKPLFEAVPEVAGTPISRVLEQVLKTGETIEGKEMLIPLAPRDGAPVKDHYFNFIQQARFDESGQIDGIITFAYDITELVEARKKVEQSEKDLQMLNEQLAAANKEIQSANEELTATNEALREMNKQLLAAQRALDQLNNELEAKVGIRTRELQHAQREAEAQLNQLHEILMQAPAAIGLFKGPAHVFKLVNPLFRQLFDTRPLLNRPIGEALPELADQGFFAIMDQVYRTGETFYGNEMPAQLDRNNTGVLTEGYFNLVYQAMRNPQGEVEGILLFAFEVTEQVLVRKQVQQNKALLNGLANTSPVALWMSDATAGICYVNQTWIDWTGRPFEAHLGQGWGLSILEEDRKMALDKLVHDLQARAYYQVEFRIQRADGSVHWCLAEGVPRHLDDGTFAGYVGSCNNITRRKQSEHKLQAISEELAAANQQLTAANEELKAANAEIQARKKALRDTLEQTVALNEKLSEQESFLASILDQSPLAIWIADQNGTAIRINEACLKLFGLEDEQEAIGQYNIFRDNTLQGQSFYKNIEAVFREGKITQFETEYDARRVEHVAVSTGRPVTVVFTLFPIKNQMGTITNVVIQAEDVTKRKKAEAALAYQNLLTQTITDNATSCLLMMDQKGYCTFMNPAGEKLFGYTFEEISQAPLHYLIHHHRPDGSFYPLQECPIDRALPENFDIRAHEDVFFRKDGSSFPVSCAASPIFENGVPVSTVIEVRDVTQEKQAQAQLLEMNAQLSQKNGELERINTDLSRVNADLDNFVYTASHDLRAPINNMEGLLDLLGMQLAGRLEADEQESMRHLLVSLQKLNRTINDLSDIVKASKDTNLKPEVVDMQQLLEETKEDIAPLLSASDAQLVTEWKLTALHYPRKHLRSILYNLLSNAVKYRHPDRVARVTIRTQRLKGGESLSVTDNGLGLEPQQVSKLFKMFGRLHPHIEGTGIGLYTIKRMVENYGGSISVESTPGEGTTFTVYFPPLS